MCVFLCVTERERECEGGREGGREGGMERGREGEREGGREGGRERGGGRGGLENHFRCLRTTVPLCLPAALLCVRAWRALTPHSRTHIVFPTSKYSETAKHFGNGRRGAARALQAPARRGSAGSRGMPSTETRRRRGRGTRGTRSKPWGSSRRRAAGAPAPTNGFDSACRPCAAQGAERNSCAAQRTE